MQDNEPKVECRTPTPGKQPTRIASWKYDAVEAAILSVVREAGSLGTPFKTLPGQVQTKLSSEMLKNLGSVSWLTTTVKLEMEVRGILKRANGDGGQRLTLGDGK